MRNSLGIPDAAQAGQAPQRCQPRLRSGGERRQPGRLRNPHRTARRGGYQPRQCSGPGDAENRRPVTEPGAHQRHDRRHEQSGRGEAGQRSPEHHRRPVATAGADCVPSRPGNPGPKPDHRHRHPRQAAIAHQQTPVPLQKPFGHIGIPDRDGGGDQLPGHPGVGQEPARQASGSPPGQEQTRDQQRLHDDPAVDDGGEGRDGEILRNSARRILAEAQRRVSEVGAGRRHRIANEEIARRQQGCGHRQRQNHRVAGHRPTVHRCHCGGGGGSGRRVGIFSVGA